MSMNNFSGKSLLCILCVLLLSSLNRANTELEESLVKNVKILAGVVERVSKLEKEMKFIQKTLFGEGFDKEALQHETIKPRKFKPVTASITKVGGDEIEFKIEHEFENVIHVRWSRDYVLLPDSECLKKQEPRYVSMVVPSSALLGASRYFGRPPIAVLMETSEIQFTFVFNTLSAIELLNATNSLQTEDSLSEEIPITVPTISPSQNLGYTPGEEVVLKIGGRYSNDSKILYHIVTLNDNPNDSVVIMYASFDQDPLINISDASESGQWKIKATINTTSLTTGGVLFWRDASNVAGNVIKSFDSVQMIYLHPRTQQDPVPVNRVALTPYSSSQYIHLDKPKSPIVCMAFGNPTPQVELREDGRRMNLDYAEWSRAFGNQITALVPRDTINHNISCYAKSGEAELEMPIVLKSGLRLVKEESGLRRITEDVVEITCTIQGFPPPTISFYKNRATDENLLSPQMANVEIANSTYEYTTKATVIVDTSSLNDLYEILCVSKQDEDSIYEYFPLR